MKKDIIEQAVADISDRYVQEATANSRKRRLWPAALAAVLALVLAVGAVTQPWTRTPAVNGSPGLLPTASAAGYEPDYSRVYGGEPLAEDYLAAIRAFAARAGRELLDGSKTTAYSPTALYTALSMVAELADDDRQADLLAALGAEGMEDLRQYSGDLWRCLCADPDMKAPGKVTLANSLWLDGRREYNGDTLQTLANDYYVSSFTGDMTGDIPQRVSEWVREQTNDLLDCQVEPDGDTLAILLSAIYFYDEWQEKVYDVESGSFLTNGETWTPCNYLNRTQENAACYKDNGVTAAVQYFANGGKMLFILPDEGSDPASVLDNTELMTGLLGWESLDKYTAGRIEWSIPRFNMKDTLDLRSGMAALGLGDLFDSDLCPLTRLSDGDPGYISQAEQGTSIAIDENGCEAASYVEIMVKDGCAFDPEEPVYMLLTRPFVFAILSQDDVPLFLGVINTPEPEVPTRGFFWEWEKDMYDWMGDSVRTDGFVNTLPQPIESEEDAIRLARREYTGGEAQTYVFRDVENGMWKVELISPLPDDTGMEYGSSYFYVYMTDEGVTVQTVWMN